ncbi:MAG: glutamate--cysteine ligase [Synechococcales cyanobacterium RM1_1_8]|nr:glutamate--cysteine ligase [Synechococcales cyanobacterium RM1_1_8]
MQLTKGFEIELYTGTPSGKIVGLSHQIADTLTGFVREPDSRNVEYITAPRQNYDPLVCDLLEPRRRLRRYLQTLGDYTLHPGSTLSLGDSKTFYRSAPENPYHDYIEQTYGTNVVTASVHINVGLADPEALMQACRLIRVEAPLFLALSAASPFLDGQPTGYHSSRWQVFPQTPQRVPLFASHLDHINWVDLQLELGTMQSVRHLWSSVRPNGDRRPYDLNRLELRICDLVTDPIHLLAITALLEARMQQMLAQPNLDPLTASRFTPDELLDLTAQNEAAVAKDSLNAQLTHWQDGRRLSARDWIQDLYDRTWPLAKAEGYSGFLAPLQEILRDGNQAQRWLAQYDQGMSCEAIVQGAIAQMQQQEEELANKICKPLATLG